MIQAKIVADSINILPNEAKGWCRNYRGFIMYRELLD